MKELTLTAPLPPNIANNRMHWRTKLKAKKRYWGSLNTLSLIGRIPISPLASRTQTGPTRIAATLYVHNLMDDDNAMARVKWLLDWLVANDYLPGDARKNIQWAGMPEQVIDRKNPRIELTLTPIAA